MNKEPKMKLAYKIAWNILEKPSTLSNIAIAEITGLNIQEIESLAVKHEVYRTIKSWVRESPTHFILAKKVIADIENNRPVYLPISSRDDSSDDH